MSNEITKPKQAQALSLSALVVQPAVANRLTELLRDRKPQFVSSMLAVARGFAKPCAPQSVLEAALMAATLDLPINKSLGFAWIVPYAGEAQFQLGYKGYIQLALRTGQYAGMNAKIVNAGALKGFDSIGDPVIDWDSIDETLPAVGYVFAWRLVNGFSKICYWPKTKVEAHAKRYSQAYRGNRETPWKTDFDAMALKTVISNELRRWGIMSIEMTTAFQVDQAVIGADGDIKYIDNLGAAPRDAIAIELPDTSGLQPEVQPPSTLQPDDAEEKPAPPPGTAANHAVTNLIDTATISLNAKRTVSSLDESLESWQFEFATIPEDKRQAAIDTLNAVYAARKNVIQSNKSERTKAELFSE